ncbi:hypothetical protein ESCO_004501 [Escovopsis weberi]|uniref:Uncharacterized protein n=1 Tax=Escovopsis weberi TaxID=150374 RepID=A0A0M8N6G1_ESCWE|nr:hypothetical protein ESCO_004501 [Escovopsis weberi]
MQWNVGPVPDYIYSNSTHPPSDIHNHPYQTEMNRRNERMDFPYGTGAPQPNMAPQHLHNTPVQPPMSVSQPQQQPPPPQQQQQQQQQPPQSQQQPPNGPAPQQQQTQAPAPAPTGRQRKRPAPNAAPSPAQGSAPPPPASAAQGQPAAPTPPAPQAAASAQPSAAAGDESGAAPAPGPPAKKSRTNTPWTPQEEHRLKMMRDAGKSWAEIAKTFPTRTEGSVKKHWYKDMHYAEFAEDESQALMIAIREWENAKWKVIGQKVGKPAKACEQYAKEHFPGQMSK